MPAKYGHLNKGCFGVAEPMRNSKVLWNLGTPDHGHVLLLADAVQVVVGLGETLVLPAL